MCIRDRHCVPSLSSSQIKAKFRAEYVRRQNAKGGTPAPWYEGCWDRALGVDPEAELAIEAGADGGKKAAGGSKAGGKVGVVEAARQRRMRQARRERLPEASLLMATRGEEGGPLEGRLQIRGDPGSLLML